MKKKRNVYLISRCQSNGIRIQSIDSDCSEIINENNLFNRLHEISELNRKENFECLFKIERRLYK